MIAKLKMFTIFYNEYLKFIKEIIIPSCLVSAPHGLFTLASPAICMLYTFLALTCVWDAETSSARRALFTLNASTLKAIKKPEPLYGIAISPEGKPVIKPESGAFYPEINFLIIG